MLPPEFQVALAGGGVEVERLQQRIQSPRLAGRAHYVGVLPKSELWSFYQALDCLAAPHLTFPHWKEQFGGVLADAMAVGLPIVGSDSGAIPEVVGPAGLIVPENNALELATAIRRLRDEPQLADRFAQNGIARFAKEFAIPAYAEKIARALGISQQRKPHVAAA
jgi:glycosyltransferase involved in cell wall biosynthesis